ncbi:unnamed protein product [Darwinula stevensoni]|uniref:Bromodomain adjacent to zinc finger domain protein 1A n=1 Tax=Darwinula stevensoni TaxID=69355 RepID=A0A7R9FRU1_9CRUS|nr:unnamed protein product [Darwinula stevensoni]CAG0901953.1 unnamed protein product [Darwinula stevensoni]
MPTSGDYFKRVILCNSLLWTCELTGKPNLTFQEALESERKARKCLKTLPKQLKRSLIFLTTLTCRGRILDLWEDIYSYAREHYFIGDLVEAVIDDLWCDCKVIKVIPPNEAEIEEWRASCKEESNADGEHESKGKALKDAELGPPACLYKYEVEEIPDEEEEDENSHEAPKKVVVEADDIRRLKGLFTREKNKLFLRQCTELNSKGLWVVRERVKKAYEIDSLKFDDICSGPQPKFPVSEGSKKMSRLSSPAGSPRKASSKQTDIRKFLGDSRQPAKRGPKPKNQLDRQQHEFDDMQKRMMERSEIQKKFEELRLQKMEDKAKEREKKKEERRLYQEYLREWNKPREDLECDDLKILPQPRPVHCRVPNALFGDMIQVLEFLHIFATPLAVRRVFPNGLAFERLESALIEVDVQSPLSDILQLLLKTVFALQREEEAEMGSSAEELNSDVGSALLQESKSDLTMAQAVEQASQAAIWPQKHFRMNLTQLQMDALTLTEVLRLHLLASGAQGSEKNKVWRYQQRGGFSGTDDPGLIFRTEESAILQKLSNGTVFALSPGEKLKILTCLINQILTFAAIRDVMDENIEKYQALRKDIRALRMDEAKKEKEEAAVRAKQKQEDKHKQGESKEKGKERNYDDLAGELSERKDTRRKTETQRKERELITALSTAKATFNISYLGRDRAYRRFWVFSSIPGLFVEHDDDYVGLCLPVATPVPKEAGTKGPTKEDIRKFFNKQADPHHEEKNAGSDKENDTVEGAQLKTPEVMRTYSRKTQAKSDALTDKTGKENIPAVKSEEVPHPEDIHPSEASDSPKMEVEEEEEMPKEENCLWLCSADKDNCVVHSTFLPKTTWAFYSTAEEFDSLVGSLNPRGIREKYLQETLIADKERIISNLEKCPVHKLDLESREGLRMLEVRKSERRRAAGGQNMNLNFPPGTAPEEVLELTFRDFLLEMEEKIQGGGLGSLKVKDRDAWRAAIEQRTYDQQCATLLWGGQYTTKSILDSLEAEVKGEPDDTDENDVKENIQENGGNEEEEEIDEAEKHERERLRLVREMAAALLQLGQSVEVKYLQPPLGESDKEKAKRKQQQQQQQKQGRVEEEEDGDEESARAKKKKLTPLQRWELSLKSCTSFPQLFLHFSVLESSVMWSRSVLYARCRICRRKGDEANMLLCDGCDRGHHIYCLKPKLKVIPSGDWFCESCRPKEVVPPVPSRRRRMFSEHEEEEEEEQAEEEEEEEEENEEVEEEDEEEETRPEKDESMRSSDEEDDEKMVYEDEEDEDGGEEDEDDGEEKSDEQDDSKEEHIELEVCGKCSEPGELLMCDNCPGMYHLGCVKPPLSRVPRGKWYCHKCQGRSRSSGTEVLADPNVVEVCTKCGEVGLLLLCETCPRMYHLECLIPPLAAIPDGDWFCPSCARDPSSSERVHKSQTSIACLLRSPQSVEGRRDGSKSRRLESPAHEEVSVQEGRGKRQSASRASERNVQARKRRSSSGSRESTPVDEEELVPRGRGKRQSAARASERITHTSKRGRSSSGSRESTPVHEALISKGRGKRLSAARASERITQATKHGRSSSGSRESTPEYFATSTSRRRSGRLRTDVELDYATLEALLTELAKHPDAWPFLRPVSRKEAPDYYEVIEKPMDFGTMKGKLHRGEYKSNVEFLSDIELIFDNCKLYNYETTEEYRSAVRMTKFFETTAKEHGLAVPDGNTPPAVKRSRR